MLGKCVQSWKGLKLRNEVGNMGSVSNIPTEFEERIKLEKIE